MSKDKIVLDGETYIKETKSKSKEDVTKTYVNVILDMSGSMSSVQSSTIAGYNEYIMGLQSASEGSYYVTLTVFDTSDIKMLYKSVNVKDVPKLTKDEYRPNAGTPLYDAVCKTLAPYVEGTKAGLKYIAVIITDGFENSSSEFNEKDMMSMKEKLESKNNWSFVYLGADQDAWSVASKWGFDKGNVSNFNKTDLGTRHTFMVMSSSTQSFARGSSLNTSDYFSEDQKKKMDEMK